MATRCCTTPPEKSLKSFEGLQCAVRHTFERLMISCKLSSLSGFRTMLQLVTILRSRVSRKIDHALRNFSPSVLLSSELGFSKICETDKEFSFLKFSSRKTIDVKRSTKEKNCFVEHSTSLLFFKLFCWVSGLFLKHLDLIYISATSNCPLPKSRISASSFRDRNLRAVTVVRDRVNASYKHKSNFLASNANRLSRGEIRGTSVPVLRPNSQRKCYNGRRKGYARCTLFRRRVKRVEVSFRRGQTRFRDR